MRKFYWRSIEDTELSLSFLISPYSGLLLSQPSGSTKNEMSWLLQYFFGFRKNKFSQNSFSRGVIIDAVPLVDEKLDRYAKSMRATVERVVSVFPLYFAIIILERIFYTRASKKTELTVALSNIAAAFGVRSNQDCLVVSMCRHLLLNHLHIKSALVLGTHVPTEKMHAWVEVDQSPILECPDVIVHYQACVKFY